MKKREVENFEFRKFEVRAIEQEGKKFLNGSLPYNTFSEDLGSFREVLRPGCFTKTINENIIYCLINHNTDKSLGNNKTGSLIFKDMPEALEFSVELNPDVSFAMDLFEQIKRGDVKGVSFGFSAIRENWDNISNIRELIEVKLYEVSLGVVFSAYSTSNSFAEQRSIITAFEELNDDDREAVLKTLNEIIKSTEKPLAPQESRQAEEKIDLSYFEYKIKLLKEKE